MSDLLDTQLRLDALRAAAANTLDLLANGDLAGAQVELGHAFMLEVVADQEAVNG